MSELDRVGRPIRHRMTDPCEFCGTSVRLDTEDDRHWPFETERERCADGWVSHVHTPERCVERGWRRDV